MKELEIDFEVLREPWNKYSIEDDSYIKSRYVITKFKKREPTSTEEKLAYGFEGQTMQVAYNVPKELKGKASTKKYTQKELSENTKDLRFSIIFEEWNEYVLEDGTVARIKNSVVEVVRTDKFDRHGDPIYIVNTSQLLGLKPRKTP